MGDRYIINLFCPYCGKENEEVYYAESSGFTDWRCEFCKKRFDIELRFVAMPKEEEE